MKVSGCSRVGRRVRRSVRSQSQTREDVRYLAPGEHTIVDQTICIQKYVSPEVERKILELVDRDLCKP